MEYQMSEINNQPTLATTEELIAEVTRLTEALSASKTQIEFLGAHLEKWSKSWEAVETALEVFLEDGLINEGEDALSDYLIETFDLSTTEEHEVTLTITYSGTIVTKKGAELGNLCLENEPSWSANVEIDGEIVGELSLDGTDYDY
jgi:hypothetical protein